MKVIVSLSIWVFLSSFLTSQKQRGKVTVDFYITPRNAKYGWYNNGVENFDFNRKSVKVPFDRRSYTTITEKDSLYELYYKRILIDNNILSSMILKSSEVKNDTFDIKRIAVIINKKPKSDTIFVDRNYIFSLKGKLYKMDKEFLSFIERLMPIEIKENWINDLPPML